MAGYRLLIKPSAAKEIEALGQKKDRQRIVNRIAALAAEPRLAEVKSLPAPKDAIAFAKVSSASSMRSMMQPAPLKSSRWCIAAKSIVAI